jgi:hypothetical protein
MLSKRESYLPVCGQLQTSSAKKKVIKHGTSNDYPYDYRLMRFQVLYMNKNELLFALIVALLSACQSTHLRTPFVMPANATLVPATFKHVVINQPGDSQRLHVYIEGDGIPFESRFVRAKDPSPNHLLMLQLMQIDKNQSLYLGRPCYFNRSFQQPPDEQCNPHLWTDARYSDAVVDSMVTALRTYLRNASVQGITLIGHSGGGTLAMLMAARLPEVDQLVTIAGNLDTAAWTRLHHYTPLKNSLNPAKLAPNTLPSHQIHIAGDKDNNIPPALGQAVLNPMGLQMTIIKNADHGCCWAIHWPSLLQLINEQMTY